MKLLIFLICITLPQITLGFVKRYTNYTLFRTLPLSPKHLQFIKNLSSTFTVDFWRPPGSVNKPVDLLVAPENKKQFIRSMDEHEFYFTTIMEDVQSALDQQTIKQYVRRNMDTYDWNNYFRLTDIYNWIMDLEKAHPNVVEIIKIGKTYENRDLICVRVFHRSQRKRSTVVVEGGIHAREWISVAFVTYFMNQIINYDKFDNPELKKIALLYEFYFIPVTNPDGYVYSTNEDRLWRKNRRDGVGVDINRNFDIAFGSEGVEFDYKSEIYCGKTAFSELESQALSKFVRSKQSDIEYYLAFHSYGQYLILPYAYSRAHRGNFREVVNILEKVRDEISRRYNTAYTIGTAYDTVGYLTSGVSGCWVKAEFAVPFVTTFELRDSGHHGFALPPSQILPTCLETMDGVISYLQPKTEKLRKLRNNEIPKLNDEDGQDIIVLDNFLIFMNICLLVKYCFV